jgi:hypothetical protein
MSEVRKIELKKVIQEELNIANALLTDEDFHNLNIVGNRIMENCLFANDYRLFLPGFFLKELALIYNRIFTNSKAVAFQTAKTLGQKFIDKVSEILEKEIDENLLWEEFHIFRIKMRNYTKSESEKKFYTDNHEVSETALKYLMSYLKEKESYLYVKYNQFFNAILNILDRTFRAHSGDLKLTLIFSYFKMLERLYEYLIVEYFDGEEINVEGLKKILSPFLEYLYTIIIVKEIDTKKFDEMLWQIVKLWRDYYIYFVNATRLIHTGPPSQKIIQLPEETRRVIEESLKESIEKKIK